MKDKKIGLALGGGSVRGLAHIGVLKVLEKNDIPVSFISGTSIGAVIGAAYCSGLKAEEIEKIVFTTDFQTLMDFTIPKRGLLVGRKIETLMSDITRGKTFDKLIIPLSVIATDLKRSQKVVLSKGNVARAIRASIAIPPFFTPVLIRNHELVDGGLVDPVPITELKEMGADKIIAVDISHNIPSSHPDNRNPKQKSSFPHIFYERFIRTEYELAREIFRKKKIKYLPRFIKRLILNFIDRFLKPKNIMKFISGKRMPEIFIIMLKQLNILINQLTAERLKDPAVNIVIKPDFRDISVLDFDKAKKIIDLGEKAAKKQLPQLKKLLS